MVWVPGGQFLMGSNGPHALPNEQPVHPVEVSGFFMDRDVVTNAQFAAFVEATGYVTVAERAVDVAALMAQLPPGTPEPPKEHIAPGALVFTPVAVVDFRDASQWWRFVPGANWRHPSGPESSIEGKESHPVVQIAWDDAVAYADWLGRRLPTEAEWELAARGGAERLEYVWGDTPFDPEHPQAHIYKGIFPAHEATTRPVGSFPPNAYGLRDMSGNVWQWTLDWFDPNAYRERVRRVVRNPRGPASGIGPAPTRVMRGGSFLCSDSYCRGYRVSARNSGAPDTGGPHIGFRTVMTVEQWKAWQGKRQTS